MLNAEKSRYSSGLRPRRGKAVYKLFLVLMIIAAGITNLQAQNQVEIILKQPPPNQLGVGDMWNLELNNTSGKDIKIYLTGTATEEKDGLIIEGKSKPFTIKPGRSTYKYNDFSGAEVKYNNGKYKEIILRTGNAPEGSYTICVTAFDESGTEVGRENCIMQQVQQSGSITLISPEDGGEITREQPIIFSWTPLPGAKDYTLRIVEIKGDQSPDVAMKTNKPVWEKSGIATTTIQVPYIAIDEPGLKIMDKKKKWGWQVISGDVESEINTVIYLPRHIPLISLVSPANGQEIDPDTLPGLEFKWKECPRCPPMYTLRIVELKGSQSPEEAFRTNQPIFEKELSTTSYQGDPIHGVDVKLGMKLAWQVSSGDVVSEVYTLNVKKSGKDSSIFCKSDPARCMGQRCLCPKFFTELNMEKQNVLRVDRSSFMGIKLIRLKPGKGSGTSIENILVVFSGADPYLTGDPIAGVDVAGPDDNIMPIVKTDEKGMILFKDADKIPEGRYEIKIVLDGISYKHILEVSQSNGKEDQIIAIADAKAGPLAGISASQVPQNRLDKVDRVKGKVIKNPNGGMGIIIGDFPDKDSYVGDPVDDVDVGLGRRPGGIIKWVKTDGNGLFDFSSVEPGNYIFKYVTKGDTTDFDINVSSGQVTKAAYISNTEEMFDKFWISIELNGSIIGVGACPCFRVTCHCEHR